jgi:NADPH2:quinone reductase
MRAVAPLAEPPGFPPRLVDTPNPVPGPGEVLVAVRATGINRADLLQLRGQYPPPAGESLIPGLEVAGEIVGLGPGVSRWRVGDRIAALLAGGGHAELVAVPETQAFSIWEGASWSTAAAVPESGVTAWTNLVEEGGLVSGQTVVVTGATGGVGSFTIQLASRLGARVIAVSRRPLEVAQALKELGADEVVGGESWERLAVEATGGRGADLLLDLVGGEEFGRGLKSLRAGGRAVLLGLLAGATTQLDLAWVLRRRLRIVGSVLRPRSRDEKGKLVAAFASFAIPLLASGRLTPRIASEFPFERIADAYLALPGILGKGEIGKVVVTVP